jgi:hypothetical protein
VTPPAENQEEGFVSYPLFERHRVLLDQALNAIAVRGYWRACRATGANPAANASLTDSFFVTGGFRVAQHPMHV